MTIYFVVKFFIIEVHRNHIHKTTATLPSLYSASVGRYIIAALQLIICDVLIVWFPEQFKSSLPKRPRQIQTAFLRRLTSVALLQNPLAEKAVIVQ